MKQKLKSLRIRMLLPVITMSVFVVVMLTTLFSRAYINMIMQQEINRTSLALNHQMDTIRRMEREQMEQENLLKEKERLAKELITARQIQSSVLPHIFPPFPDRKEINLFASMDPARDVGGDFYDFFFIDEDHLCLVIADVSGKGIPALYSCLFLSFSASFSVSFLPLSLPLLCFFLFFPVIRQVY